MQADGQMSRAWVGSPQRACMRTHASCQETRADARWWRMVMHYHACMHADVQGAYGSHPCFAVTFFGWWNAARMMPPASNAALTATSMYGSCLHPCSTYGCRQSAAVKGCGELMPAPAWRCTTRRRCGCACGGDGEVAAAGRRVQTWLECNCISTTDRGMLVRCGPLCQQYGVAGAHLHLVVCWQSLDWNHMATCDALLPKLAKARAMSSIIGLGRALRHLILRQA